PAARRVGGCPGGDRGGAEDWAGLGAAGSPAGRIREDGALAMMARRATLIGGVLLAVACVERVSAPGACPSFYPSGQIQIVDTVLTSIIARDSAFRRYVTEPHAPLLVAPDLPG